MISKTFDDDISKLDPLQVYKILHAHDLLTTKLARYKPIVNHNIQPFFVAAGNLRWNKSVISKKSILLTETWEPVVINSSASFCLSHNKGDFVGSICASKIKTLQTVKDHIKVEGEGTVQWVTHDINGQRLIIQITVLYIPEAHIILFPPQVWLDNATQGSKYTMRKHVSCICTGEGAELIIPYHLNNNLPTLFVSQKDQPAINIVQDIVQPKSADIFSSVMAETNQNLTPAQNELLVWHWKLSRIEFQWLQSLISISH